MPRLGVPADIERVSARFKQPGTRLNPLALVWDHPLTVVLERSRLGSRIFAAHWLEGPQRMPMGLRYSPSGMFQRPSLLP